VEVTPEPGVRLPGDDRALIKSRAGAFQWIHPAASGETRFARVHLNPGVARTNNTYYDAIRFRTPPRPGLNLVWAMTRRPGDTLRSWSMIGLMADMKGGFKDFFHGQTSFYSNVPQGQGGELVVQFLDGRMLKPDAEYLICFEFADQTPLDSQVAMVFAPSPDAGEADTVSLERALGLTLKAPDPEGPNAGNQTPRFHRHLCMGVR
jgi:hypothetical protein